MDEKRRIQIYEDEEELREALVELKYSVVEKFLGNHQEAIDSIFPYDGKLPQGAREYGLSVLPVSEEDELLASALYNGLVQLRGTHRVANAKIDTAKIYKATISGRPESQPVVREVAATFATELKEGKRFVIVDGLGRESTYVNFRQIFSDAAKGLQLGKDEVLALYCVLSGEQGLIASITPMTRER